MFPSIRKKFVQRSCRSSINLLFVFVQWRVWGKVDGTLQGLWVLLPSTHGGIKAGVEEEDYKVLCRLN